MITTDGVSYTIRTATFCDSDEIARLEGICFPQAEAASPHAIRERLRVYPEHFYLAESEGRIISVVDGPVTIGRDLTDEMYEDTSCHDPKGGWQMIFGVETHPELQGKGIASSVLSVFLENARDRGYKGAVLTCKEELTDFYERFGFINEGISSSVHGGAVWYQMRLLF